jgi:L-fucose mutarotase/ribose pyranase (RbsD/FucU family)
VISRDWNSRLAEDLPVLGHRNWIVIADSAYPAQSGRGVDTIYTGQSHLDTLKTVLQMLERARHVQPVVHLDAELEHVSAAMAPGITEHRTGLKGIIGSRAVVTMPHEELISTLDEAGRTFRIIILKTDLTIPYTSVFLRLDCGYWGAEKEKALRESIAAGRG